ncbi:hypothetical protein QQP08_013885 [Theobroma cacao]|nr:hypothetical protein QQP08_013885 [Theobroma cacao]
MKKKFNSTTIAEIIFKGVEQQELYGPGFALNPRDHCPFSSTASKSNGPCFSFIGQCAFSASKMQAEKQQQSWKVSIQARAQNFNFKLQATKILPTWKFHRFSLLLRLHKFALKLQVKSRSTLSISIQNKRTLKSTFLKLLEKLRIRRPKRTLTVQHPGVKSVLNRLKQFANEKAIYAGPLVIAILASLLQSISKKDIKGIITHASIILMYWILYYKRHIKGKTSTFWRVLIVGTAGFWVALHFGKGYRFQSMPGVGWHGALLLLLGVGNAACQVIFALVKLHFSHISKLKEQWFKIVYKL